MSPGELQVRPDLHCVPYMWAHRSGARLIRTLRAGTLASLATVWLQNPVPLTAPARWASNLGNRKPTLRSSTGFRESSGIYSLLSAPGPRAEVRVPAAGLGAAAVRCARRGGPGLRPAPVSGRRVRAVQGVGRREWGTGSGTQGAGRRERGAGRGAQGTCPSTSEASSLSLAPLSLASAYEQGWF